MMESRKFASPTSRRRVRFSLRTALMSIAFVAIGVSLWVSYRQHEESLRLRQENTRLRGELGELSVEEGQENELHAVAIPSVDSLVWKWRLWVPTGRTFYLNAITNKIPAVGAKRSASLPGAEVPLREGEQTVTVALRKDHLDRWQWMIQSSAGGISWGASKKTVSLIEGGNMASGTNAVSTQQSVQPGKELELLRYRVFDSSARSEAADEGALVWISETTAPD